MGLTIHYTLVAPPDTDAARARELVRAMRRHALGSKHRGRVDNVLPIGDGPKELRLAMDYQSIPHPTRPGTFTGIEIAPEVGFIFPVLVGRDCEPLWLGLCRYPKTVPHADRRHRTRLAGWCFSRFSKTQYASLHGWEHFRRCHTAATDLLQGFRKLGIAVNITDEGEYWPGRSLAALRKNLDEMNGLVAAMAGRLKDGDAQVESPIFQHARFERLEAEGEAKMGVRIRQAGKAVADLLA